MADGQYIGPAIQINPASGFATEMRKWESTFTQYGPPGRQWQYEEYPCEMLLAGHPDGRPGKIDIVNQRTIHNDSERTALEQDGWRVGHTAAVEAQQARDLEMAKAAAEANFDDRRMSDRAREERAEVEDATAFHVAEIPRAHPRTGMRELK